MPSSNATPADPHCIFCRIIAGDIPSYKVYEDDDVLSFLDIGPLAQGHVLVIPKPHHVTLDTMPESLVAACARTVTRLAKAVTAVTGVKDYNILQNNGAAAGQVVMHVHFHIIPRKADDNLGFRWPAGKLESDDARRLQEAFAKQLS